ncbi:sensor domain-containing diguanylate cyclase [Pigmentiphaga aceris]|nr:diguanylate cyclase [Pigmentiphaga aceris]
MGYRSIARLLDTLDVAFCAFDAQDRAILWNETFLLFFPEHRGHIFEGEPYQENLRRFYLSRMSSDDVALLERHVAEGVLRNRTQTRPFHFEHNGRWVRVSSVPESSGGRLRIWVQIQANDPNQLRDQQPERMASAIAIPDPSAFLDTVGAAAAFLDAQRRIVSVNAQFLAIYGFTDAQEVVTKTYAEIVHDLWCNTEVAEERELHEHDISVALVDALYFSGAPFELPLPGKRWVRITMNWSGDGQMYALHWDITESKRHETELRESERRAKDTQRQLRAVTNDLRLETHRLEQTEERIRKTFVSSGIPTIVVLDDGSLIDANRAAGAMFEYGIDDLLRCTLNDLIGMDLSDIAFEGERGNQESQIVSGVEIDFYRKGGSRGCCQLFGARSLRVAGAASHAVLHMLDVTTRKSEALANEEKLLRLQRDAFNDPLTGVGNRRYLELMLRDWLADGGVHALLFLDLDGFKAVNDLAGHAAGDSLLRKIAKVISKTLRVGDVMGRLGGDEFLVLLRHCEPLRARPLAVKIIAAVNAAGASSESGMPPVGASIGIRGFGGEDEPVHSLISDADVACYAAKRAGKNRAEVFGDAD